MGPAPAPPPPRARPGPQACWPAARCAPGRPAAPRAFAGREPASAHTRHTGCPRRPRHPRRLAVLWEQEWVCQVPPHWHTQTSTLSPGPACHQPVEGAPRPSSTMRTCGSRPQAGDVHVQTPGLLGREGPEGPSCHGGTFSLAQARGSGQRRRHRHLDRHRGLGWCSHRPLPWGGGEGTASWHPGLTVL